MKIKRFLVLALATVCLLCTACSNNFAMQNIAIAGWPNTDMNSEYFNLYFDLTPFGYANFAPFVVALLTCALTVMIVVSIVSKKPMRTPILTVSAVATVLSLAPLLYGISFFSIVGAFISVALALTTVVAFLKEKDVTE